MPPTTTSPGLRRRANDPRASDANNLLAITFDDGSTMNVKVTPSDENTAATGKMEGAPTGARV